MINELHHLQKLIGIYNVAQEAKSQEVRLTITELTLIIEDLNKLLSLNIEDQKKDYVTIVADDLDIDAGSF